MEKKDDKKFTWVIKNFSSLQSNVCWSEIFVTGGCKWFLSSDPNIKDLHQLYLRLILFDGPSLPSGWRRYVKYRLTIVNQLSEELSIVEDGLPWLDPRISCLASALFPFSQIHDKDGGFLLNGELKIVAEVDVVEVIGDAIDASEKDGANGFQVHPSQVESLRRIFEKHPDIAVEMRAKNQHLRNSCMNALLSLIETMCQPLQELSTEDLVEADNALNYVKESGFKVEWLKKKLDQLKENKEKELMLQETEENLLKLKLKCSEMDAIVKEQKAELLATRTTLCFDDLV